jgi:uncharacterized NAD(P)/FAD-binding protein YdhS
MTRIAMIGGGPKCLFALLELNDCLDEQTARTVQVDVYDPYLPGAGRVWNTTQPGELRLNVNARIIDASSSLCSQTFNQWRSSDSSSAQEDTYPPRALVGEYLGEQFERLRKQGNLQVAHRASAVGKLVRSGSYWEVTTQRGNELYDEVVIVTGHGLAGYRAENSPEGSIAAAGLTVERGTNNVDEVPAGSHVLCRGAALTAYDVILSLTEGRGGTWEARTTNGLPGLCYLPSGDEPERITMTSRNNIPMSPKSQSVPENLQSTLEAYREKVRLWGTPNGASHEMNALWQILLSCAKDCAELSGVPANKKSLWETLQAGRSEHMQTLGGPAEQLRRSLRANHGLETPTHEWVWAFVWSGVYAQLVSALARIPWRTGEREQFSCLAANLERMAFGPPEPTAFKLLALFDAGLLNQALFNKPVEAGAVFIDAVTAPAGVLAGPAPEGQPANTLFNGLLAHGEVLIRSGERGLLTETDGTCLNARGERNESLAALGRPTEDPTLGHDTLNRTLHPEYRGWAQRIARKVTTESQKVAH